jgi:hypothetical protein
MELEEHKKILFGVSGLISTNNDGFYNKINQVLYQQRIIFLELKRKVKILESSQQVMISNRFKVVRRCLLSESVFLLRIFISNLKSSRLVSNWKCKFKWTLKEFISSQSGMGGRKFFVTFCICS